MYSMADYGRMVADRVRMDAYLAAMERVIRPGSIVVDLGAGPGVIAVHACRLGAARVYAIEPDDSIAVAMEIARDNGVQDRIEFFQDVAAGVTLPEPADVIVSDMRGVLPLNGSHFQVIADVRQRWLRPRGTLMPARDELMGCLVRYDSYHARIAAAWQSPREGVDLKGAAKWCFNLPQKVVLSPDVLIGEPRRWSLIDYRTQEGSDVAGDLAFSVDAPADAFGVALWFDTEIVDGIGFSNRPGPNAGVYGQQFLPWPQRVALQSRDRVTVSLAAALKGGEYHWRWTTEIAGADGARRHRFVQASAMGVPIGPKTLKTLGESHVPAAGPRAKALRVVLDGIDRAQPLGDIARDLLAQCGALFGGDFPAALRFAADVSREQE